MEVITDMITLTAATSTYGPINSESSGLLAAAII